MERIDADDSTISYQLTVLLQSLRAHVERGQACSKCSLACDEMIDRIGNGELGVL